MLLHPERINSYAAAGGRTVRSHLQQIGVLHESAMLAGQLNCGDIERLPPREDTPVHSARRLPQVSVETQVNILRRCSRPT